jgi:CheY-like chemotaxis protein
LSHSKKYYIVDDDTDDRQFLIEALTENDPTAQCISVNSGQAAITNLKKEILALPDAIFLDQNMPGVSGKQCLAELKSSALLQHIPVIIYSTSFDEKEISKVMQLGSFYFLVKSSSFSKLKKELLFITAALDKFSYKLSISNRLKEK